MTPADRHALAEEAARNHPQIFALHDETALLTETVERALAKQQAQYEAERDAADLAKHKKPIEATNDALRISDMGHVGPKIDSFGRVYLAESDLEKIRGWIMEEKERL